MPCRYDSYRHFHMSDSMCVCAPNYEFVDGDGVVKSESDGEADCQPINYPRCLGPSSSRDALGRCVAPDCSSTSRCASGAGVWQPEAGLCECVIEEPLEVWVHARHDAPALSRILSSALYSRLLARSCASPTLVPPPVS